MTDVYAHAPELPAEALEVDVLLFEIGGILYGTDASQVIRIDRANVDAINEESLGALREGRRAVVFEDHEGFEAQLRVDAVHGIHPATIQDLRRMPMAAQCRPFTQGVWLKISGEEVSPIILIDLLALAIARAEPPSEPI